MLSNSFLKISRCTTAPGPPSFTGPDQGILFATSLLIHFVHIHMIMTYIKAELFFREKVLRNNLMSAAWPIASKGRFNDDHDCKVNGLTPIQVSLLRPWIRCFTTIISAWWNLTSSKLKRLETKFQRKTRKQGQLLSESAGFVLCIAPPSLSRDRRTKIKKSINRCFSK